MHRHAKRRIDAQPHATKKVEIGLDDSQRQSERKSAAGLAKRKVWAKLDDSGAEAVDSTWEPTEWRLILASA